MVHQAQNVLTPPRLRARLQDLWERTGDDALRRLAQGEPPRDGLDELTEQGRADWTSTCLMHTYMTTGDPAVFALIYELNQAAFMQAIQARLRRYYPSVDPGDVLQEVFLNIYRYPHRFKAGKADSFRNWGHRIVRNTLLKFLKGETRQSHFLTLDDEIAQPADPMARPPDRVASESESAVIVDRAYLLYLNLYLIHFQKLSAKERRALTMVEVEAASYKDAAAELGIRLENLKMVIFRGRRKIFRGMHNTLQKLDALQSTQN